MIRLYRPFSCSAGSYACCRSSQRREKDLKRWQLKSSSIQIFFHSLTVNRHLGQAYWCYTRSAPKELRYDFQFTGLTMSNYACANAPFPREVSVRMQRSFGTASIMEHEFSVYWLCIIVRTSWRVAVIIVGQIIRLILMLLLYSSVIHCHILNCNLFHLMQAISLWPNRDLCIYINFSAISVACIVYFSLFAHFRRTLFEMQNKLNKTLVRWSIVNEGTRAGSISWRIQVGELDYRMAISRLFSIKPMALRLTLPRRTWWQLSAGACAFAHACMSKIDV
jgi:hypothetical protein